MLDYVLQETACFLESMPKSKRKKKGQFFTSKETAIFMANMFDLSLLPRKIDALDPGTGTGILSAALIERLEKSGTIEEVSLTCYETDEDVLPVLKRNLEYIKMQAKIVFNYKIVKEDYILSQSYDFEGMLLANPNPPKYDLVIGNPPYLRVLRDHAAAQAMPTVVHGAPNLYFLFASMSLFNLKLGKEMVYIIPRSWTSGAYFKAFREYFLRKGKLSHIHLFVSRDKVFSQEQVLQETIILKLVKTTDEPINVLLTSSQSNSDFNSITELLVPYGSVVTGKDLYVILPTSKEDIDTIQKINRYSQTMPDIGLRMKTGIVVDFRQWEDLRPEPDEHTLPLFYSQHIRNGRVNHQPSGKEYDWVIDEKPGLIQENKDYVFCKRFTAKEEHRRLQCGIYLASDFPEYDKIGTQNKINFVERSDKKKMSKEAIYGIFAVLNSTLFDQYYRILNGSTQVNSTEINSIPVPPLALIEKIGTELIDSESLSTNVCDEILNEVAYG
ncbi:MAG: Eco57I restriction-modification methylase domain-containing protein [Eubacteriales bacterium]|nr:Eco57I restriction-modification methylase domain-containing protein [Eubacteriales bacterium]